MGTIVVLGTGGTIAGTAPAAAADGDYDSATLAVATLIAGVAAPTGFRLESEQVAQLDSKDMDFATWRRLAMRLEHHLARAEVKGVVVTHGTDTLEETAYFLHRVIATQAKPVVLTGAMRPATSRNADGPGNLADAVTVAAGRDARGVVAVMAGTVHSARAVRKTHPARLDAFTSGDAGALGRIDGGRIDVAREWPSARGIGAAALPADPVDWPMVAIVTSTAGADAHQVRALVDAGFAGIVVAATGNGTLHRELEAALHDASMRGPLAVLRSTRCQGGAIVEPKTRRLGKAAFASAGDLSPQKARVELMLRLMTDARPRATPSAAAPRAKPNAAPPRGAALRRRRA